MLDQILNRTDQGTARPRMRPAPSPQPKSDVSDFGHSKSAELGQARVRMGEGWGEGVTNDRELGSPSPPPSPRWGEGVPPCRDESSCSSTRSAQGRTNLIFNLALCAMLSAFAASGAQAQDNVASFY